MVDITHKNSTLRIATAQAKIKFSKSSTLDAIKNNTVPKGNVLEMAKTAGLFAVKNTHLSIPDCHPLPIEYTAVEYQIGEDCIDIFFHVKTVYKTGVEVEAMHGASIVALTMYDMLKPIDKEIEILNIKLVQKKGGKSNYKDEFNSPIKTAIIVCSDAVYSGKKEDKAGQAIKEKLSGMPIDLLHYEILPDDFELIQQKAKDLSSSIQLIIFSGGTGLSPTDVTPQALEPLLDTRIYGIEEAIRNYGQQRMPYAMLSRSLAGTINESIILALPGSTNGAIESIDAVFPQVLHAFHIFKGTNQTK